MMGTSIMTRLAKEVCFHGQGYVNIGQAITECSICDCIIHRGGAKSNFVQLCPRLPYFFKVGQNFVGQNWTKLDKIGHKY